MLKYNSLKLTQVYFKYDRNREEGSGQKRPKKCGHFLLSQRIILIQDTLEY